MRTMRGVVFGLIMMVCIAAATGCQKMYYDAMETVGIEKREILVDRSEATRDSLHRITVEYSVVLNRLASIVQLDALTPEQRYEQSAELVESAQDRSDELTKGINKTDDVAAALFEDWDSQTRAQTSEALRATSQQRLDETREAFRTMMRPVRDAADRLPPILSALNKHVMHLKLNYTDEAAETVRNELEQSTTDVAGLLEKAQSAIDASNEFITAMNRQMNRK